MWTKELSYIRSITATATDTSHTSSFAHSELSKPWFGNQDRDGRLSLQLVETGYTLKVIERERRAFLRTRVRNSFVKSILPTTENWLRKLCKYSKKYYKSTEDNIETNHINNKYNDTNMNTRKMHNI